MSNNLFQNRPVSPIPSVAGEEYEDGGETATSSGARPRGNPGVFRQEGRAAMLKGRPPVGHDPRKFKYDVTRGMGANLGFEATKDDRMSAAEAGDMLDRIHRVEGVDREVEGFLRAFDKALFFCHTVNGGSVLAPGRANFSIPGASQVFSYEKIRDMLGVDQRRFFRAYADDIADVNKEVLRDYDPYDPVSAEQWGWLMQVAYDRGLHRFPHLAHDSADACLKVSPAERAALSASKVLVISTSNNSADRLKANSRVASADGFDSTVGKSV